MTCPWPARSPRLRPPASPPFSPGALGSGGRPGPPTCGGGRAAGGGRRSTDGEAWRLSPRRLIDERVPVLLHLRRGFLLEIHHVSGPVARVADVLLVARGETELVHRVLGLVVRRGEIVEAFHHQDFQERVADDRDAER